MSDLMDGFHHHPLTLVTTKSDAEIATALRTEAAPLLIQLCALMDRARSHGLTLNFQLAPDAFGRHKVAGEISVVRPL